MEADEHLARHLRWDRTRRLLDGATVVMRRPRHVVLYHKTFLAFAALTIALLIGVYRVETLAVRSCENVEELKTAQREEARESFRNLDRNLKLLGIAKTPEVVRAAEKSRDDKLRRFASHSC